MRDDLVGGPARSGTIMIEAEAMPAEQQKRKIK